MGDKRMISREVVETDRFLDMPLSAQALYFHLNLYADDEGFVSSPRKVQRSLGCTYDDLKLLIAKAYVIPFESGIVVITHWYILNSLRKDRCKDTIYQREKALLTITDGGEYQLSTDCQPSDNQLSTNCPPNISKVNNISQNKTSKDNPPNGETADQTKTEKQKKVRFIPPTIDEIKAFCAESGISIDAAYFIDYYNANGWQVGKHKMQDWKATVRNWNRRNNGTQTNNAPVNNGSDLDGIF